MTRADALAALAVAPFVIVCVLLIAAAVWLAVQEERRPVAPLSPETQAARESLRAAAWGGGER